MIDRFVLRAGLAMLLILSGGPGVTAQTLRWGADSDAISMDPHSVNETFTLGFTGNIYEGLVYRDNDMSLKPALAESWRRPDPHTWIFTLRKGVRFHNGSPLMADDVIFSYQRAISAGSDMKGYFGAVESMQAKGTHEVIVKTRGPQPILLAEISPWLIMDKQWTEANQAAEVVDVRKGGDNHASRQANGTGPFMLVTRQSGVKTEFRRNPDWWGWQAGAGDSNLQQALFTPVRQDANRTAALLSKELDFIYPVPVQDIGRLKKARVDVMQSPELRTIYLAMDLARHELLDSSVKGRNPFKDKRVRLAMYQAIDPRAIVRQVMHGAATPANAMVAPAVVGHDPKFRRMQYNPQAARDLLKQAGYPKGFEIGLDCPNDRYVNDAQICQAVVSMWAKIGIRARLLAQTTSVFFQKVLSRNTTVYLLGWSPITVDGHDVLQSLLMTYNREAGVGRYNLGNYSNARLDALASQVAVEMDAARRLSLLTEALNLAHSDVATIPLHYQQVIWAAQPQVSVVQRPDQVFALRWASLR